MTADPSPDILAAIALLKAKGYTVIPPPDDDMPELAVGQVWTSPNARHKSRTITAIRPAYNGRPVGTIEFTRPSASPGAERPYDTVLASHWRRWARRTGSRP